MDKLEEHFYETAANEIATNTMKQGVMAKAFTMAPHDEKAAFAAYIQLRVQQLTEETAANLAASRQKAQEEKVKEYAKSGRRTPEQDRSDMRVGCTFMAVCGLIVLLIIIACSK